MGASLNFVSLEAILFLLPFTSQFNSSANPDSPFSMCPGSSHFSPLSHYLSLIHLKLSHPSNALLFPLLLPLFPYHNSHQSSQNDHANPFRSWIIHSISHHFHSGPDGCLLHTPDALRQGLPFPAPNTFSQAYKRSASHSLIITFKTAILNPTHSSFLVYFSPLHSSPSNILCSLSVSLN